MHKTRDFVALALAVHISVEWPAGAIPDPLTIEAPEHWLLLLVLWLMLDRSRRL